ncbi:predicted protein [Postia placenta Mad-698-R]|uniref:FYR N-terminal domain-containing protein n=1 Tax=Postia placenta MAD-698-R-SB12 TaxID=670580 RepID=A0A1X6MLP9_9APHY|nr:hypothetical protein POSPLADRAFT_1174760 [Postia placenta MAD-698-R-SB12]EED78631.1 predicted protein [Postia placenta Mad-698-R]OSX57285.1 hypothetical protein POSPLADRAFT_1174760 [Postia placenta MAD-698-R-SB12]
MSPIAAAVADGEEVSGPWSRDIRRGPGVRVGGVVGRRFRRLTCPNQSINATPNALSPPRSPPGAVAVATVASPWRGMPLDPSRPYPLFSLNPHHSRPRVAMSRAHKSNMAPPQNMGPPQDVVMGPPPLPPQVAQSTSQKSNSTDVVEKYRRLKRKYFDLEEKYKESILQLRGSGERNVKWRAERRFFLDRITELESNPQLNPGALNLAPPFNAFPRSLLSVSGQKYFVNNLRQATDEVVRGDADIDPYLLSRHVGPDARKRAEAELKERQEEEAREARRTVRRPRGGAKTKDIGAPLTFAPAGTPPVLVSSSGTRLRLKPPAPPSSEGGSLVGGGHPQDRSPSPPSPLQSPHDEYGPPLAHGHVADMAPPPPQSQMQMTLRTSSTGGLAAATRPSDLQRHAKPKRLKAHTVQSKNYSIPTVPRDAKGSPILPLNVGIMTVHRLGEVCTREHFHTERYIFPIGYEVTRRYASTIDMRAEVQYTCTILDGGDGPKFRIIAADQPDKPIVAGTATGAWPLGGRHAAVMPALSDDHEGQGAGGGYYADRGDGERELQIIQEGEDHQAYLPPPPPAPPSNKPIMFQQEYREYVRPAERGEQEPPMRRERRSSRSSNSRYEDYVETDSVVGPPDARRTMSHSPVMHREREREREHEHYSPQQMPPPHVTRSHSHSSMSSPHAHHRSPYQPPARNGEAAAGPVTPRHHYMPASPPPVPATLASIMHAYPAPPGPAGPPDTEYTYTNGSGHRRNGH